MSKSEYDKIVRLMKSGALQGIDTGRIEGKCEDVIPLEDAIAIIDAVYREESEGVVNVAEIVNTIHEQGVENEVFELLTQWMIADRHNKMVKIRENEATIRAINKIATQNRNIKQAIDGITSLSEK